MQDENTMATTKLSHRAYSALTTLCRVGHSGHEPIVDKRDRAALDGLVKLGACTRSLSEWRYTATPKAREVLAADVALPGRRPSR